MNQNLNNDTGMEFYDLSHPWGFQAPNWPYFEDAKIERLHYHAKSGVLTQKITTVMHNSTHIDAPAHVIEGAPFIDQMPLPGFFGHGVVVSIPKEQWGVITPEDLENATPKIQEGDILIINTGWHHKYADSTDYFVRSPGTYKEAGDWMVEKKIKLFGIDCQAQDHPLATAIGPHGPGGPLMPWVLDEYREFSGGREVIDDFPLWEPCHRALMSNGICGIENVGGELDLVTGKRCTFAAFPWRWVRGDGCIVRLVAMIDKTGEYRMEQGSTE